MQRCAEAGPTTTSRHFRVLQACSGHTHMHYSHMLRNPTMRAPSFPTSAHVWSLRCEFTHLRRPQPKWPGSGGKSRQANL